MKLQIQRDFDASQIRFSQASSYMAESRTEARKKNSHKGSQDYKKKSSLKLKQLVEKLKVVQISKQFINKLKLLVPLRKIPNELLSFRQEPTNLYQLFLLKLKETLGFKVGTLFNLVWRVIIFLKIICMVVFTSLLLGFQGKQFFGMVIGALQICITISILDIFINFFCQKFQNNRNFKTILSIANSYIKNDFLLDFMTVILSISLRVCLNYVSISILMALTIIKLWRSIHKIQFLQHVYILNVSFEKYIAIGRVFFFNFLIAHFIAITLLLMAKINIEQSWIAAKDLDDVQWSEQYVWACYWGINIMLTVGFGDFSAHNKNQALVLVFIELISCMIFAYNINVIGSILADMKQRQRERKNQMRILLKMAKENQIDNNLLEQAVNYVDQSFKIKEKFQYQNHDEIIENLPLSIQSEYKKQTNRKMILGLSLMGYFSQKSLLKVAEKVVRKLAHPEQIIWKRNQLSRLVILYDGKLGLTYRRDNSKLNGSVIQILKAVSKKSKILSLNFFKNQRYAYDIKSLNYGIIYHLSNEQFADALQQKSTDYELFCSYRDKLDSRFDVGDLYKCRFCPLSRHDYFNCPKMHLVLVKDHVISKSNLGLKSYGTCTRDFISRAYKSKSYIKLVKLLKADHESFINLVSWKGNNQNDQNQNQKTIQDVFALAMSQKIATSIRSNKPISHIFRELDIHKLNTILVSKLNDQEMCKGFWDLECDVGHNFNSYFRTNNPDYLKDLHFKVNKNKILKYSSLHMHTMISQAY